jgi:plastocyanin
MEASAPALFLIAVLVWQLDFGDDATFFLIVLAIPLLGALLVWRFGSWAKVLGIVAALLPALAMFWTAFGLSSPGSFFDFVPGILMIPGALIAIMSLIASLVAAKRGRRGPVAVGGERAAIRIVVGLVLLLALVSAGLTYAGRSTVANAAAADQTLQAKNSKFEPNTLTIESGDSILVRNDDPFFHTFTIEALEIDQSLTPGDQILVNMPDKAGTYAFYCRPHTENPENPKDTDMAGKVSIT